MIFGLFGGAQATSTTLGAGVGQGFHDYIDFHVEADALGYHSTFCVEHHFTGWTQISATLNLLTWLAARTKKLRVGTAVMVLPWHNPVLLAEQAATLDLLSGGRLDLGIGKGYRHNEFKGFNVPADEAEARFDEALDVMIRAWTSTERFSHHGRFWQFDDIIVEPPAAQKPTLRQLIPSKEEWKLSTGPIGRGSLIGFLIGIIPGSAHIISSFVSYGVERRLSKHPERFGKGAIEGVAGPESANNAAATGAFVPMLALGIPTGPISFDLANEIIFKGIRVHGITGRRLFSTWYRLAGLFKAGLNIKPIITHTFPMNDFAKGFELINSGQCGKVVLFP